MSSPVSVGGYVYIPSRGKITCYSADDGSVDELGTGASGELITRTTPFYPEQGGQVGDQGVIEVDGARFEVEDTKKPVDGLIVHRGKVTAGVFKPGAKADRPTEKLR